MDQFEFSRCFSAAFIENGMEKYVKEEMYVDEEVAKEHKHIQLGHIKTIKGMIE